MPGLESKGAPPPTPPPNPSDIVVTEKTSGQTESSGDSATYSRGDHTHGTPAAPTHQIKQVTLWHTPSTKNTASWEDIPDMAVTLTTGANPVLIIFDCMAYASGVASDISVVIMIDGVLRDRSTKRTYIPNADTYKFIGNHWLEKLSAGEHTIKAQWYVSGGTVELGNLVLSVEEMH